MSEQEKNVVVEAKGLIKVFSDFWGRPKARAVNGIDFTVRQGQVFGLLGPNGSGKSTTIKMILGLLYPTRGVLKVFGKDPQNVDIKSRIGYLPEETYLYKYLTAFETLDFFGALFGQEPSLRHERAAKLLDMVGLAHAYNRPVGEFSKGMARRIGLAQALVNDPDLIILDEPTSGLDPIGCREVKDIIRTLAARGKTIILCSHLLADVQDVCDDMIVLYGGKVRANGALEEILQEEDKTTLTMPTLSDETIAELKSWLKAKGISDDIEVEHPSKSLEDFFLDVVKQAREQSVATAGVQSSGEIPEYLTGTAVLDALRRQEKSREDEAPAQEEPKVDQEVLNRLTVEKPAPKQEPKPAEEDEAEKEARRRANEALANRFGKK
jgi:ABC-2 type transport system ATP-binding protein